MKVLVTGPSGSGKTYVSSKLAEEGLPVADADTLEGLTGWFDFSGNKVEFPANANATFFNEHTFLWDLDFLKQYLSKYKTIYLFGLSDNIFEAVELFDKKFYLVTLNNVLLSRFQTSSRENPMGSTIEQRELILSSAEEMKKKARQRGFSLVDSTLTPLEIYEIISS